MFQRASIFVLAVLFASCSGSSSIQITGAGSTFDYPFFSKAFYTYSTTHPNVTVNYQPIGSGGGIQQLTRKTVDFGASDVPMNAAELKRVSGAVIQVPVTLGGVVLSYNLSGVGNGLHLSGKAIADIYLGKVRNWNDPELRALNPAAHLPNLAIAVVHRSEASGTTYIFTDYLSSVSPEWNSRAGKSKSVAWPAPSSIGGKGNDGVAGLIRNTPGAIGYIELAYALQNSMPAALIQNAAGKWVACTQASVSAAAASKPSVSAKNFSIVNASGAQAYPIAGYSWVIVYQKPVDPNRGKLVKQITTWLIGPQAQAIAGSLRYAPLPPNVQASAQRTLSAMSG